MILHKKIINNDPGLIYPNKPKNLYSNLLQDTIKTNIILTHILIMIIIFFLIINNINITHIKYF